ncbi:Uncharacterised protein [Nocardiopsis dassonvillei]|uniref:Uncharacterized protein n=1 Tax=Nocardiopsis dassonvillei (strain ATCC 23218 / DSM 43111 / CIP 107115 / JCM 7437 / KCTC 9190 / NBRC 14626 / NCTC 10488 / NRRL B-5397 / IMRU 509) TaxID=446468 RepID=D7AVX0_NOCDD|nr:conserved hypothetical protein [Nocardiopsis dassonvillei subsp. dassonvillei DSM 43111]VEI90142.1 Uncharacterised protein [Nocardiopsis dassonvillei]
MPETTIYENGNPGSSKSDIHCATVTLKGAKIDTVTHTSSVQLLPHSDLRFSVATAVASHGAPNLW